MEYTIPAFPTGISKKIELPNIAELLFYPMFWGMPVEKFMKEANEFQKEVMNMVPLRNTKRHVLVQWMVQVLSPNLRGAPSFTGYKNEWHYDTSMFEPDAIYHIMQSECSCKTEFNEHALTIDLDESYADDRNQIEFEKYVNENWENMGIISKPIEANKIVTFENHLHRSVEPKEREFRFFFRVRECDDYNYNPNSQSRIGMSKAFLAGTSRAVSNIALHNDRVIIFNPDYA